MKKESRLDRVRHAAMAALDAGLSALDYAEKYKHDELFQKLSIWGAGRSNRDSLKKVRNLCRNKPTDEMKKYLRLAEASELLVMRAMIRGDASALVWAMYTDEDGDWVTEHRDPITGKRSRRAFRDGMVLKKEAK